MHEDARGSFTEFLRTDGQGQFSVNISHPHIVKGNHWHHTKHEKFLVVKGKGVIRLRKLRPIECREENWKWWKFRRAIRIASRTRGKRIW